MAAHLNIFSFWRRCTPGADLEREPSWLAIEHLSCRQTCLPALLNSPIKVKNTLSDKNPVIQNSMKVWNQLLGTVKAPKTYLDTPICNNHAFKPGLEDMTFVIWRRKGICSLKDIYMDGHLASFQQLRMKFNLPNSHFFRFLQLRHFIKASIPHYETIPHHSVLDSFMSVKPYTRGAVSRLYNVVLNIHSPSSDTFREQWQEEFGVEVTDDVWQESIKNIYCSSINARHNLIKFKVVYRLHLSPSKLQKIYKNVSSLCFKCSKDQ